MNWVRLPYFQTADEIDSIPQGWTVSQAESLYDQLPIGLRYEKKVTQERGLVPVIDQSETGVLGFHDNEPGINASVQSPVATFANHTCEMRWMTKPFSVIQNVFPLRGKVGVCETRFLYYATKGRVWLEEYKGHFPDYRRMWLPLPPQSEQRAIASILGALDDKIELNRQMSETLEALAQALFQSWFVDATANGLPKGWREGPLDDLAAIQGGKQLPTSECQPRGTFPVFGANGIMGYAERATHDGFVIAFGRVGAYCGSIHWTYSGAWINNNASSVVPHRWPEFVLQAMLNVDFEAMRTGSAQPFIPNSALSSAQVLRPPDDVLDEYCSLVRPLRLKQDILDRESRTLTALRDTLLPKLLSGELRVPTI